MTELSNLCGLAQVRAVKKSCHAALVFSHAVQTDTIPSHEADFQERWVEWVLSNQTEWAEDSPMTGQPIRVHCSGLGGRLLTGDHGYDIFLQNHAQQKVYGPSLAMVDDWLQKITQLGRTKSTPTWTMALQQIMRCYHPQGKILYLQACFPAKQSLRLTGTTRAVDVLGFSAGSFTGLALHAILWDFECFPGETKVAVPLLSLLTL